MLTITRKIINSRTQLSYTKLFHVIPQKPRGKSARQRITVLHRGAVWFRNLCKPLVCTFLACS